MPYVTKMQYIVDRYGDDEAVIEAIVYNKDSIEESDLMFKCRGVKNGKGYFDAVIRNKDGIMIDYIESISCTSIKDACQIAVDYAIKYAINNTSSFVSAI
jgi:hypothetical protein